MRLWIFVLLLAIPVIAQAPAQSSAPSPQATPLSQAIPPEDENARKAHALLNQMIQALGGQAYLTVQNMEQEGRTYGFSHGEAAGTGAPFWRFWRWPDKDRLELTKKRDWIILTNGDQSWEITFRGARAQDPKDLAQILQRRHYSLEHVLRIWLNEPGVALFYDGAALAAQKPTQRVTITNTKGESVSIFIDDNSHFPVKKSYKVRNPEYHDMDTEAEVYDNFRNVQGIMTPFSVTRLHNEEMVNQRFIIRTRYNVPMADSLFVPKGYPTPPTTADQH
jgi:hypothetical protein